MAQPAGRIKRLTCPETAGSLQSPLDGMRAATAHHNSEERLSLEDALLMYTYDAARFGHAETQTGRLVHGYAADCVVLEGDPIARSSFSNVNIRETWIDGFCL